MEDRKTVQSSSKAFPWLGCRQSRMYAMFNVALDSKSVESSSRLNSWYLRVVSSDFSSA